MAHKQSRTKQSSLVVAVHHLINVFVPRAHNSYRPHLISRYGLAAIALVAAVGFVGSSRSGDVLGAEPAITPAALLRDVNIERTAGGVNPLQGNAQLAAAALAKGNNMFTDQYWAHTSPSGVTPWQWIQDEGYAYSYAGENLAKNFDSAQATVDAWLASPSHRENMLRPYYTEAGFAIVDGILDGRSATIIVALFAAPQTVTSGVAGVTSGSDVGSSIGILARVGLGLQTMSPAVLGAIALSLVALLVAVATFATTHLEFFKRRRRSASAKGSWLQHHTITKAIGLTTFVAALVIIFGSGGQL